MRVYQDSGRCEPARAGCCRRWSLRWWRSVLRSRVRQAARKTAGCRARQSCWRASSTAGPAPAAPALLASWQLLPGAVQRLDTAAHTHFGGCACPGDNIVSVVPGCAGPGRSSICFVRPLCWSTMSMGYPPMSRYLLCCALCVHDWNAAWLLLSN